MEEKKYKILIVDDDQFLLNMYSSKFGKNGFDATTVTSGQEALSKLKEGFTPDILLLDVTLPGMDGVELLQKIREERLAQKSVVIMLTNSDKEQDMARAKALDVDGYILKAATLPSEVIDEVIKIVSVSRR